MLNELKNRLSSTVARKRKQTEIIELSPQTNWDAVRNVINLLVVRKFLYYPHLYNVCKEYIKENDFLVSDGEIIRNTKAANVIINPLDVIFSTWDTQYGFYFRTDFCDYERMINIKANLPFPRHGMNNALGPKLKTEQEYLNLWTHITHLVQDEVVSVIEGKSLDIELNVI